MKSVNGYYKGYSNNDDKLNFLKFEILNEFGPSLRCSKNIYQEDSIVKKKCKKMSINNQVKK